MSGRIVSDKCSEVLDPWLYITGRYAAIKQAIHDGVNTDVLAGYLADISLITTGFLDENVLNAEDVETIKGHNETIRRHIETNERSRAKDMTHSALKWSGRTMADRVVQCECGNSGITPPKLKEVDIIPEEHLAFRRAAELRDEGQRITMKKEADGYHIYCEE